MRKKSELFFSLILIPIDFIAIFGSFIAAYAIRVKIEARPVAYPLGIEFFLKVFLLIVPLWILFFALTGLYNQTSMRGRLQEMGKIFVAVSAGFMAMIVIDFVSGTPIFPAKAVPIYAFGIGLIAVTFGREIVRAIQRSLFRAGIGAYRTVIIGSGKLAQRLAADLSHPRSGFKLIGVIDSAKGAQTRMSPLRVDSSFVNLMNRLKGSHIDEFIQADSSLKQEEIFELVEYAATNHITYRFVPNQFGLFAANAELGTLYGVPMVAMRRTPLEGWGRIIKRGFDVVASLIGLVILSPVFLVLALLIKITDPGPVFYLHERLSRTGGRIYIRKFRSMRWKYSTGGRASGKTDAQIFAELGRPELYEQFKKEQKLADDPRISPIGRVLRSTSLDELPQLLNILKGDISLVGPRPIVRDELIKYGQGRSTLLSLRPGLTGLWQVSGRNNLSYDERVKLDIYYIENWSLLLDIKIILRTIIIVLTGRGAY